MTAFKTCIPFPAGGRGGYPLPILMVYFRYFQVAWLCWKIDVGLPWEALALVGRRPVETLFTTLHRHLIMLTERSRHHPPYITYIPYFCRTLWLRSTDISMAVPIFAFCKKFSSFHYSPFTYIPLRGHELEICLYASLYLFSTSLSSSFFCHHLFFVIILGNLSFTF